MEGLREGFSGTTMHQCMLGGGWQRNFFSSGHPTPVSASAKCFQLSEEMAQGNLPLSPPLCPGASCTGHRHCHHPCSCLAARGSCRATPARLSYPDSLWPLLPPSAHGRGVAAASYRCPAQCSLPSAWHCSPKHPDTALVAIEPRTRVRGQPGSFPAQQKSTAWLSASSYLPKFIFLVFCL